MYGRDRAAILRSDGMHAQHGCCTPEAAGSTGETGQVGRLFPPFYLIGTHAWLSDKYIDYWTYVLWNLRTVFTWWCPNSWVPGNCLSTSWCLTSIGMLTLHIRDSVDHWWLYGDLQKAREGGTENVHVWSLPLDHGSTFIYNRICKCDLCCNIRNFDTLSSSTYMHEYVSQQRMREAVWHHNSPLEHAITHSLSNYIRDRHCFT